MIRLSASYRKRSKITDFYKVYNEYWWLFRFRLFTALNFLVFLFDISRSRLAFFLSQALKNRVCEQSIVISY